MMARVSAVSSPRWRLEPVLPLKTPKLTPSFHHFTRLKNGVRASSRAGPKSILRSSAYLLAWSVAKAVIAVIRASL